MGLNSVLILNVWWKKNKRKKKHLKSFLWPILKEKTCINVIEMNWPFRKSLDLSVMLLLHIYLRSFNLRKGVVCLYNGRKSSLSNISDLRLWAHSWFAPAEFKQKSTCSLFCIRGSNFLHIYQPYSTVTILFLNISSKMHHFEVHVIQLFFSLMLKNVSSTYIKI